MAVSLGKYAVAAAVVMIVDMVAMDTLDSKAGEALVLSATPGLVEALARAMDIPKVSAAERTMSFTATLRKAGRLA